MDVRFMIIEQGPGPAEMLVGIATADGRQEEVVISRQSGQNGTLEVGSALIEEANRCLIELPRESIAGRWRIWVPRSEILDPRRAAAAE